MKKILIALMALGLFACSSSEKKEAEVTAKAEMEQTKENVEQTAKDISEEAKEEAKQAYESTKEAAQEAKEDAEASAKAAFEDYVGTEKSKLTCTNSQSAEDVRTVTVMDGSEGGCGVVYSKFGTSKTVAVAENNVEYCTEVKDRIKGNLENSGLFSCAE